MPTCPSGHETASTDFCDECGIRIDAPPTPVPAPAGAGVTAGGPSAAAGSGGGQAPDPGVAPCPRCGVPRSGQFCEACGYAFETGHAPGSAPARRPAGWTAVVTADRDHYDKLVAAGDVAADAVQFPAYCPERRFPLAATELRIGRHSASRGLEPEIDLTGPPTDPGVSRLHAVLVAEPDGSWAVIDPGSENGTMVNDTEIRPGVRVPLHDGDRIHVGAWTTLTIQAR